VADERRVVTGLRAVAVFEAAKGLLVMLVGLGLFSLIHRDVEQVAESVVRHLHLNPARHYPRIFLQAAARLTDARLWILASGAFAYAVLRGVEAWGLWRARPWAEWLAILSGALYLPVELYEIVHRPTPLKAVILVVNAGIVAYVAYVRHAERHHR
jgi:uncharacterized membrane protein (DUF2068 family)